VAHYGCGQQKTHIFDKQIGVNMNETAFPAQALGGLGYTTGMTLRDYFAAKAMQGQLSIRENVTAIAREQIKLEDVCIASYEVADAMMKARGK
jgi:hypothetical protein